MSKSSTARSLDNSVCECTNPFCGDEHAPYVSMFATQAEADVAEAEYYASGADGEGPSTPEYSEYDAESYDEMVREDMAGLS